MSDEDGVASDLVFLQHRGTRYIPVESRYNEWSVLEQQPIFIGEHITLNVYASITAQQPASVSQRNDVIGSGME